MRFFSEKLLMSLVPFIHADRPYFVGPFRPRPGVQQDEYYAAECVKPCTITAKMNNPNIPRKAFLRFRGHLSTKNVNDLLPFSVCVVLIDTVDALNDSIDLQTPLMVLVSN